MASLCRICLKDSRSRRRKARTLTAAMITSSASTDAANAAIAAPRLMSSPLMVKID